MSAEKEIKTFEEESVKRGNTALHSFIALILAGFANVGVLNQGTSNIVGGAAGKSIANLLKEKGILVQCKDDRIECIREAVGIFEKEFEYQGIVSIEPKAEDGSEFLLKVKTKSCKICPIQVGRAALKGSACLFPHFFLTFFNNFLPYEVEIVLKNNEPLFKDGDFCIMHYKFI